MKHDSELYSKNGVMVDESKYKNKLIVENKSKNNDHKEINNK